jgi:hypothetical protein
MQGMSHAVVWSENGGPVYAGRLELGERSVELAGGAPGREAHRKLLYDELAGARIERDRSARLAGLPTLVLDLHAGRRLSIASLRSPGLLPELIELLQTRCAEAAA